MGDNLLIWVNRGGFDPSPSSSAATAMEKRPLYRVYAPPRVCIALGVTVTIVPQLDRRSADEPLSRVGGIRSLRPTNGSFPSRSIRFSFPRVGLVKDEAVCWKI